MPPKTTKGKAFGEWDQNKPARDQTPAARCFLQVVGSAVILTDQGGGKRRSGMVNHFSNRHSPNSNSRVTAAIPASKTTGPNQSISVTIPKPHWPARHPFELQD
jgi:hypothetical protein